MKFEARLKFNWCLAVLFALLVVSMSSVSTAKAASVDRTNADTAYHDILSRFWRGSPSDGHPVTTSDDGKPVPITANALPPEKGHFWEYGTEIELIWMYWKVTGSPDASTRLASSWRWVQSFWSERDFQVCGVGTTSTAQDDAAWDASTLLELYEATRDPVALRYTKDLLDCAWNRWDDTALGGSLWYNDAHSEKSSYQGPYAVTLHDYYLFTGDSSYLDKAKMLTDWANARLKRPDGIYWEGLLPSGEPNGVRRPEDIHEAGSVSFLAGNMALAVMNARLCASTHNQAYCDSAISTARGIELRETLPGNVLMNDRDAFVDGWAAYYYARDVTPLLPPQGTADKTTILATAHSIMANARGGDGTYSGNWAGPFEGSWYKIQSTNFRLNVSANTAMWPVAAAMFAN